MAASLVGFLLSLLLSRPTPQQGARPIHPQGAALSGGARYPGFPRAIQRATSPADSCSDRTCPRCADFDRERADEQPLIARSGGNLTAEIVIAHCAYDFTWLPRVRAEIEASGFSLRRVTVYSKCGRYEELIKKAELNGVHIVGLPNVGRNDHSWAYHLASRFFSLEDVVLFIKDSHFAYPLRELRELLLPVPEVLERARVRGFACFRRPDLNGSEWHVRRETMKFRIGAYFSASSRAKQLHKARMQIHELSASEFASDMTMCEFASRVVGNQNRRLAHLFGQAFIPVCYGGSFAVSAKRVQAFSQQAFKRLEVMLRRGDSIEEGHFAERLWAAFLAPPMRWPEQVRFASGAGRNFAMVGGLMGISYTGAVKRCCCEWPPHKLERRPTPIPEKSELAAYSFQRAVAGARDRPASTVVLVSHSFDLDGAPRYLLQLAALLRAEGHSVLCVAPSNGPLVAQLHALGVYVAVWPGLRAGVPSNRWRYLRTELLKHPTFANPDVVVLNTVVYADVLFENEKLRWCGRAPRFIWVLHELELDEAHKTNSGFWWGRDLVQLRAVSLLRRTHLNADAVVFVSEAQRTIWRRYDHVHFHVIPGHAEYAVDGARLSRPAARAQLNISPSTFLISTVGTLCVRKRQLLAIDALEHLVAKGADAHLVLVGSPSSLGGRGAESAYVAELRRRASTPALAGRVTFVPFTQAGWRLSGVADLHLSTSTHEAYPLNTLEAMRQGVPVIATAAGGTAEQFAADVTEWMVAPVEPTSYFISAVEKAYALHARGQLAELGRVQQQFAMGAVERFADGWNQLFDQLRHQNRVNAACGLWNPDSACAAHYRVGAPATVAPVRSLRTI